MKFLYGYLCLVFLILFHELGHFFAAKIFHVKVESFSIGIGPVLLHKKIKGTDWRISLIPLGGYCGMKGEKEIQKALDENLPYIEAEPDSLYGVNSFKRALIGFAGPFFNFILAVTAFTIINAVGYEYITFSNKINVIESTNEISYPACEAGLQDGDIIIQINNKKISDFSDIQKMIITKPDTSFQITVLRNDEELQFNLKSILNKETGQGLIGITNDPESIIKKHTPEYNFFQSIGHGIKDSIDYLGASIRGIASLFKGASLKNSVSGPVRVAEIMGSTLEDGFKISFSVGIVSSLQILGLISISLFMMNLLPVPLLDGGLILMALIEGIFRKKIKPKIHYYIQFIGLAFILVMFVIAIFGDISYFIGRGKLK